MFYIIWITFDSGDDDLVLVIFRWNSFPDFYRKANELVKEKESIPRSRMLDCRLIGLALAVLLFGIILMTLSTAKQMY